MTSREHLLGVPLPHSLAGRIAGSFFALFSVIAVTAAGVTFWSAGTALKEMASEEVETIARLKEDELTRWVTEQAKLIEVAASSQGIAEVLLQDDIGQAARFRRLFNGLAGETNDFSEIFVLTGVGGQVVASTDYMRVRAYDVASEFFLQGRQGPWIEPVYQSMDRPTVTVAAPIRDASGVTVFVLAAHLNLEEAAGLTDPSASPIAGARAYLVTSEYALVDPTGLQAERPNGAHSLGIQRAVGAGESGVDEYEDYEGQSVIGAYRWIPSQKLALLVEAPKTEALAPVYTLLGWLLVVSILAGLVALLATRLLALTITRPLSAVASAASMVAEGDFEAAAPEKGDDEVTDLARSFNQMTAHLRRTYSDLEGQVSATTLALEALEKNRSLLQAIVDNSTALIAVVDRSGDLVVANEPLQTLLGRESDGLEGEPLADLLPPQLVMEWNEARELASLHGEVVQREWQWPDSDRTYLGVWFPLTDEESGIFGTGVIATDLTERKHIEEERLRLEAQLRHTQKLESLGVLAGGIAHDFNNILAAILGHADLAAECLDDDPDEVKEHLAQVVSASQKAAELTNQMLAYAGRASFRVETVDINEAIGTIRSLVGVSLSKKVDLESALTPDPLPVRADPSQISQILMNLITNAAQAIGEDSGIVRISTRIDEGAHGQSKVILQVEDTGCGMPARMVDRIFDPFFTTKETGRGLGLAAVNGIVTGLGGHIEVDSRPGEGTSFTVSLPLAATSSAAEASLPDSSPAETSTGTLLVVDDEEGVRRVAARALERNGYTVIQAADGLEALDIFGRESSRIDGIVLDLSMPGMSGREVYEAISSVDPDTRVLFTSGYDATDAAGDVLSSPLVLYLQKPYRPGALCDSIAELLSVDPVAETLIA